MPKYTMEHDESVRGRSLSVPGTLAIWPGYGAGNPRFFVSGWFTSLVNCGELVNPLSLLGELDISACSI